VRRHGTLRTPERIARAELVAQARLDRLYGQCWKCETVSSAGLAILYVPKPLDFIFEKYLSKI
jgi:hypothetical protein